MRIHTNNLTRADLVTALEAEIKAGRIADAVTFKVRTEHRSTVRARSYEVQLESFEPGQGRRVGNSGSYGAGDNYAATFDEWGFFLAALFRVEKGLLVGTPRNPIYDGSDDFDDRTGMTYNAPRLLARIRRGYDPYPFTVGRSSNRIGRLGSGRADADDRRIDRREINAAVERFTMGKSQAGQYVRYLPRTVQDVATFHHMAVVQGSAVVTR